MITKCPDCGLPLEDIPLGLCKYHEDYYQDELEAIRRKREARPMSQKIDEATSFEELKEILFDYFVQQEDS